jgi:hypothetical protein
MNYRRVKLERTLDSYSVTQKSIYVPSVARNSGRPVKVGDFIHLDDDGPGIVWWVIKIFSKEVSAGYFLEHPRTKRSQTVTVHGFYEKSS